MGPADEVTSHLYSFGFRGKQFQYQAGQLPSGIKFHGRLTDNDVRTIQQAGGRVEIIDVHYTAQELERARKRCGLSSSDTSVSGSALSSVTVKSTLEDQQEGQGTVSFSSAPQGAEIIVDGKFVGDTPSTLRLSVGHHTVEVKLAGYHTWERQLEVTKDSEINVTSTLQREGVGLPVPLEKPAAQTAKPLSQIDVLTLLAGGVTSQRVAALVKQRGIDFEPTDEFSRDLRVAGAEEALLEELRVARRVKSSIGTSSTVGSLVAAIKQHLVRAVELVGQKAYKEAEQQYRAALQLDPEDGFLHFDVGYALDLQKKWDPAIAEYREAIRLEPDCAEAHNNLGRVLSVKHDLEGAEGELREAVRLQPDFAIAHNNLGAALIDKKERDAAIIEIREALRLQPDYAEAHGNLGVALYDGGDKQGAIREYREALRLNPDMALAHNSLGMALATTGDPEGAIGEFRTALQLQPDMAEAHAGLGGVLMSKLELGGAEAEFREAVHLRPDAPWAHQGLGMVRSLKGDRNGALEQLRIASELAPNDPTIRSAYEKVASTTGPPSSPPKPKTLATAPQEETAKMLEAARHLKLSQLKAQDKDFDGALADLAEAERIRPQWGEVFYQRGLVFAELHRYAEAAGEWKKYLAFAGPEADARTVQDKIVEWQYQAEKGEKIRLLRDEGAQSLKGFNAEGAIAAFQELAKAQPSLENLLLLAEAFWMKRDYESLSKTVSQVLALDQNSAQAILYQGAVELGQGRIGNALPTIQRGIGLDPKSAFGYELNCDALRLKGDSKNAWLQCERALQINPNSGFAHNRLGWIQWNRRNYPAGLVELRKAVEAEPANAYWQSDLAYAFLPLGDIQGALVAAREALRLDAKCPYSHDAMGMVLEAQGNVEQAILEFKEAIRLGPVDRTEFLEHLTDVHPSLLR
jgi:tetratricopeptide (TPR) repeat protein